jgi:hypothetical protein
MEEDKKKQEFDPDFSPQAIVNKEAAKDHGLNYDKKSGFYKDEDGCLRRDRFGQPL